MKRRTLVTLLCIFISITASAQENISAQIKGQLIDSTANESVPYATVKLAEKEHPSKAVKAVATDDKGRFSITAEKVGEYILSAEFIGKTTLTIPIEIKSKSTIDLGKVNMPDDDNVLAEVEVTAQKPLVKVDLDKITYSMEDDPESKTNNVLDMLKKVPMVTVDGEENIQLKGSSSFKIYMNGKPSNMIASNPKDVLKSMPASSIKDIEVITDPGAKYDAEGVTGIINIITQKNTSMGGYTATLNGRVDSRGGYGAGAYAMLKSGIIGFTGNFNHYAYKNPKGKSYVYDRIETMSGRSFVNRDGTSKSNGDGYYGNGELSFEIDTLNLISVAGNHYGGNWKNKEEGETWAGDENGVTDYNFTNWGRSKETYGSTGINADYQRTSATVKDRLLTVSYRLDLSPSDQDSRTYIRGLEGIAPINTNFGFSRQGTDGDTQEHTAQVDFTTPLGKVHNLETGFKYIYRLNKSESVYELLDSNEEWQIDERQNNINNQFKHDNHIFGAYAGHSAKWNKWGFKTGLRFEGTWQEVRYPLGSDHNYKTDYNNLIPSATVTYQLKPMQNIRFGYNMRINRPGIWQLNPYVNTSNPNAISYGNPDLDAVKSHALTINYGFFNPKLNINANLSYNFHNNGIETITWLNEEEETVRESSYFNVGKRKALNLSLYGNWSPNDKLRIYSNLSGSHVDNQANNGSGLKNNGFQGQAYAGVQYTLPRKFILGANGGFFSAYKGLQSKGTNQHFHSFNVRKSFLSDKLNLSVYVSNPFLKEFTYKNYTQGIGSYQERGNIYKQRRAGISISYKFGEMKAQIKKARRGIQNDDVSGGGGAQGGGEGGGGGAQGGGGQ